MDRLSDYFHNRFLLNGKKNAPLEREIFIDYWENYLEENHENGFETLRTFYPQLSFPIEKQINKSTEYINAVLKGKPAAVSPSKLKLNNPQHIKLQIYSSLSGKIPVIIIPDNEDFGTIIRSLVYKNNPASIPSSMGASLITGINNWSRIHDLKKKWSSQNPTGNWNTHFAENIIPNTELYKDKIIILSQKPYSNVSASQIGFTDENWRAQSLSIRLEHECTHLYTLKNYGSASNNLHDELIADYAGITKTFGKYNMNMMLNFLGLENYPQYRKGGRLENYVSSHTLSAGEFEHICLIIRNAVENLYLFDRKLRKINSEDDYIARLNTLCETDLLTIASKNGEAILTEKYADIIKKQFSINSF